MFTVSEEEAAAIRAAFEQQSKLSAAIELRRLFPAVTDNVQARNVRASLPDECRSRHDRLGCLVGVGSHRGAAPRIGKPGAWLWPLVAVNGFGWLGKYHGRATVGVAR
jgi:hypothetical protein